MELSYLLSGTQVPLVHGLIWQISVSHVRPPYLLSRHSHENEPPDIEQTPEFRQGLGLQALEEIWVWHLSPVKPDGHLHVGLDLSIRMKTIHDNFPYFRIDGHLPWGIHVPLIHGFATRQMLFWQVLPVYLLSLQSQEKPFPDNEQTPEFRQGLGLQALDEIWVWHLFPV